MDNTFLPAGYEVPESPSNYISPNKLEEGESTFRILSSAIVGYEYWTIDKKPIRLKKFPETIPLDIKIETDGSKRVKPFWAFIVWNYQIKSIQIMQITQKTIMSSIKALVDNKKWGDPKQYDISFTRSGEGVDTEYSTMPNPHSPIDIEIQNAYVDKQIDLNALYSGQDPFSLIK